MSVIPFNPVRRRPGFGQPTPKAAAPSAPAGRHGPTPGGPDERIELLERTLLDTLRENATNWAMAERARQILDGATPRRRADGRND
jgi:hypothetical protein